MEETGVVAFPRKGLTIPIHALSAAFSVDMARKMPAPRPPETYIRDKDNALLKDKDGKTQKVVDEMDSDHRGKIAEHNTLTVVAAIYHGTTAGDVIAWDTDPDRLTSNPREFYRGIFGELVAMKFSDGDLMRWWAAINKLSSIGDEEVKAASASFPE
jgi:hypothetical protein